MNDGKNQAEALAKKLGGDTDPKILECLDHQGARLMCQRQYAAWTILA